MSDPRFWGEKDYGEFFDRFNQPDVIEASLSIIDIINEAELGNFNTIMGDDEGPSEIQW